MRWMTDKVSIYYKETNTDNYGGSTQGWTRKYNLIPARVYSANLMRGTVQIEESGESYAVVQYMLVDSKVIINKGDKVIHGEDNYIALQIGATKTKYDHHKEVMLGRMDE
jgi:hypothetical protein